jgi:hypothetical protein
MGLKWMIGWKVFENVSKKAPAAVEGRWLGKGERKVSALSRRCSSLEL